MNLIKKHSETISVYANVISICANIIFTCFGAVSHLNNRTDNNDDRFDKVL